MIKVMTPRSTTLTVVRDNFNAFLHSQFLKVSFKALREMMVFYDSKRVYSTEKLFIL